jgi:hypothetical protein
MDLANVRLSMAAVSLLAAGRALELLFKSLVADVVARQPAQPGDRKHSTTRTVDETTVNRRASSRTATSPENVR